MFKFDSVLKAVDPKYMKIRHLMIASMEQQNERDRHNPNYVAPDHSLNAPYVSFNTLNRPLRNYMLRLPRVKLIRLSCV